MPVASRSRSRHRRTARCCSSPCSGPPHEPPEPHRERGDAGVELAACAACCAGPILGFLAAAGLFTALGVALLGATGLLVLVPAGIWLTARRRRQHAACRAPAIVELVAEDTTVAARFRCQGTHTGTWQGLPPTGTTMRIDEVYFFRFAGGWIRSAWGLEDTWTRMRQLAGDGVTLGELGCLSDPTAR
jgi:hypothetical protein